MTMTIPALSYNLMAFFAFFVALFALLKSESRVQTEILELTRQLYRTAYEYPLSANKLKLLNRITNQIRLAQKRNEPDWRVEKADRSSTLQPLADWSIKYLAMDGLEFRKSPFGGIGIFANRDLDINHVILRGRMNYTLSTIDSKKVLSGCINEKKISALKGHYEAYWKDNIWIALRLVFERLRKTSPFAPYLDALPYTFTHPLYFREDEFPSLSGSIAHNNAIGMQEEVYLQYAAIYEQLIANQAECNKLGLTPSRVTLDIYKWALTVCLTRLIWDDDGREVRLWPVRDMFNHAFDGEVTTLRSDGATGSSTFTLSLSKPSKRGTELLYEYSTKSSTMDLFLNSWAMIVNDASVYIYSKLYPIDNEFSVKQQVLTDYDFSTSKYIKFKPHLMPVPLEIDDFQFLAIIATGNPDPDSLSEEQWQQCWEYLGVQIKNQLESYPRSLEHNQDLRKVERQLTPNVHLILDYVIAEQKALYRAIETAKSLANNYLNRLHHKNEL